MATLFATDTDYRRMGLDRTVVLEGICHWMDWGATVAYLGSNQEFYLSFGLKVIHTCECWLKIHE